MAKKKSTKTTTAKKATSKKQLEKLNETGRRKSEATREEGLPDRRKNKRRRQIDPTTCEREYNKSEIEFMHALDEYKRASGRMFPTCSEILEVIVGLGYRQVAEPTEGFAFEKDSDSKTDSMDSEEDLDAIEKELEEQLM